MNVNILKARLQLDLPRSVVIDKFLSIRDNSFDCEYLIPYKLSVKSVYTPDPDTIARAYYESLIDQNVYLGYVIFLFSFNKEIYYLSMSETKDTFTISSMTLDQYLKNGFEPELDKLSYFDFKNCSIEELENLFFNSISSKYKEFIRFYMNNL